MRFMQCVLFRKEPIFIRSLPKVENNKNHRRVEQVPFNTAIIQL